MAADVDGPAWRLEERAWDDPAGAALREAQRAELDAFYRCSEHEPGGPPSGEDIDVFLLAVDPMDGAGLACGALRRLEPGAAEIKRMYAVPDRRGSGVATAVLRALESAARDRGWTCLRLETGTDMGWARRFYQREGYREIPRYGVYTGSDLSTCYERSLPS
jgi:GNAT superfamily N-acetyltransferase